MQETSPKSIDESNASENTSVNDTTCATQEPLNNKEDDHDMEPNDSKVTDLLTNNVNNNGPTEVSKENSEEPESFTKNGISSLPMANGQDVNVVLVNNGPPDLLGDISNNQKQTICLSKEDDSLLIDTQKSHDVNHQEEKLMNEYVLKIKFNLK